MSTQVPPINFADPDLLRKVLSTPTTSRESGEAKVKTPRAKRTPTSPELKEYRAREAARTAGTVSGVIATFAGTGLFVYSLVQLATGGAWLTTLFWALGATMFGGIILGAILGAFVYTMVKLFG